MPPPLPPRLVIVDGHAQAFRSFHALAPTRAPSGLPNNALIGLAGTLARLARPEADLPADLVAVVFDAPTEVRATFRSELFPAYKAHRSPRPPALADQLPHLPAVAQALGVAHFHDPRFEADDLIAALVALAEEAGLETVIHSADKDLMQLVSPRTHLLDTMRGKRHTPETVLERFGIPPALVPDWLALVGDSSDNIPGVPGIGPRAATRILQAAGGLEAAIAHPERLARPQAVKLLASREAAALSLSLTRLRADAPLPGLPKGDAATRLAALLPTPPPRAMQDEAFRALGLPTYLLGPTHTGGGGGSNGAHVDAAPAPQPPATPPRAPAPAQSAATPAQSAAAPAESAATPAQSVAPAPTPPRASPPRAAVPVQGSLWDD